MNQSRFTDTQIISILKEAHAGVKVKDVCRCHEISGPTSCNWKPKYAGISASDLKRMKVVSKTITLTSTRTGRII